jgi:hypothetical protein
VVGNENFNLALDPSFDYNSCISSNYIWKHFQWYFGAQIGVCLPFQLRLWMYSHTNAWTFTLGMHFGSHGLTFLHSGPLVKVCFIPKHILSRPHVFLHSILNLKLNVRVATIFI